MDINTLISIECAIKSLQAIINSSPKSARTKKVDHNLSVNLIKDNLNQAHIHFQNAGIANLSEASLLLFKEVDKVKNVSSNHGLDYSRVRSMINQILNSLKNSCIEKNLIH